MLDCIQMGVYRSPLWTPCSWSRASPVPHGPNAREAGDTGVAHVHERGAHSGLLWISHQLKPVKHGPDRVYWRPNKISPMKFTDSAHYETLHVVSTPNQWGWKFAAVQVPVSAEPFQVGR